MPSVLLPGINMPSFLAHSTRVQHSSHSQCSSICIYFCFAIRAECGRYSLVIAAFSRNGARPRERSDLGRFLPIAKNASSYRGAYKGSAFPLALLVGLHIIFATIIIIRNSCRVRLHTYPIGTYSSGLFS